MYTYVLILYTRDMCYVYVYIDILTWRDTGGFWFQGYNPHNREVDGKEQWKRMGNEDYGGFEQYLVGGILRPTASRKIIWSSLRRI